MINITPLCQKDLSWKYKKLGFGTGTIGSYGCLLVSYTMLLNYFGIKKNPIEVNEEMKNAGGYTGMTNNLWIWAVADKIYNTEYQGSFKWNNSKVVEWIKKGVPVIVKVDGKPIGGLSHYVLAIGGGKIADPFTGKIEPFSKYKPLGYHVYIYKGKAMNNDLQACLKQHNDLMAEIKEKDKTISSQATELTKYKKEEKVLIDKLETTKTDFEKAEELREKWHILYKQSQKNLDVCKLDNATFQGQITKITEKSLITCSRRTLWLELMKDYLGKREYKK